MLIKTLIINIIKNHNQIIIISRINLNSDGLLLYATLLKYLFW